MILLFSGGIDSFVAWHYLNKPKTVYFNLQSRYSLREISVVKKLIPTTIIDNSLNLSEFIHILFNLDDPIGNGVCFYVCFFHIHF